jgi:hypothetical protein
MAKNDSKPDDEEGSEETPEEETTETEETDDNKPKIKKVESATLNVQTLGKDSEWVQNEISQIKAIQEEQGREIASLRAQKSKKQRWITKSQRRKKKV